MTQSTTTVVSILAAGTALVSAVLDPEVTIVISDRQMKTAREDIRT